MTTAPIDPALLAPALAPFGSSRLLPRAAYTDPAVLEWELGEFFGEWICLGRADEVSTPGTQRAVSVGRSGVLLLRDLEGTLRAFVNSCRHRGHELLPCGTSAGRRSVVCPYHAWNYDLTGRLRNAPGFRDDAGFRPDDYALTPLPVAQWHGWVFVAPGGSAGPFADHVGAAEQVVAPYSPEALQVAAGHEYVIEANWKVIIENYQECYHCSMIHPELCQVSPPQSGENIRGAGDWVGGWMDLRPHAATMSLDGASPSAVIDTLTEHERRTVMYLALFPNLLLSLHPDYVMTHVLTPLTPGRTRVECSWLFPAEAVASPGFDPSNAVDFWDLTNRQDWAACESVQRGVSAPQWVPGPLAPDEDGVYDFVTLVANRYRGDRSGALAR